MVSTDQETEEIIENYIVNPETGILEEISSESNIISPPLDTQRETKDPNTSEVVQENLISTKKKTWITLNESTGLFESNEYSEEELEIENEVKSGKKKKSKPKTWIKNQNTLKLLRNHQMRAIPDCRCDCKTKLSKKDRKLLFTKFISLSTHTEQNIYLQGCIKEELPQRFRPRKAQGRARRVFKYVVDVTGRNVVVCATAFYAIFDIKRDRLKKKVLQKDKDIADGRGKHDKHPRKTPEEAIKRLHIFISGLPTVVSHYSRTDNKHRKYLDADLSIAELHRRFIASNPDLKNVISYEKMRETFNFDFNLSFGVPRKDICNVCEKFKVEIESAKVNNDHVRVKQLNTEKELHQRKAEVFFEKLKNAEKDKDGCTLNLCFDFQKNLPLPVTNIQDEYYRRQLWLHNFGIHNINNGTASMYLFTENYAHKGPNEVISCLNDYLQQMNDNKYKKLVLFCDNCFSQNKNKYLFAYLDQLCSVGMFETVTVNYPIPGHSMMPIDRDFAQIERKRLRKQTIYCPEYYVDLIKNSRIKQPFDIVFLERNLRKTQANERILKVKNYKSLYDDYVKPVPGISQAREVKFSKIGRPSLRHTMTGPFKSFAFYRVGVGRSIRREPENAYEASLPLKPGKIKDVIHLLSFVPESERYYYEDIIAGINTLPDVDETDNDEEVE